MREWFARVVDYFRRDALDRELADELRFHRQRLERDAAAVGLADEAAAAAARRRLGNTTRIREAARDRWSIPALDIVLQDLRYALRGLRRAPGFTLTATVTLGLGIGANAAMFDTVDRLMFRPLRWLRDPATVHRVYLQLDGQGRVLNGTTMPYPGYLDLQRQTSSFSQYAAFAERPMPVGTGETARERQIGAVTSSYFGFFDAVPALGRFFISDDDDPSRNHDVAVLAHAFWRAEFGGADVVGRTLQVGSIRATIVGVAPEGFTGINDANPVAVFIPVAVLGRAFLGPNPQQLAPYYGYARNWTNVLVRRRAGATEQQASADAQQSYLRSWEAARAVDPTRPAAQEVHPRALISSIRSAAGPNPLPEARTALWVAGVAFLVLLIAGANVTNLFLSRALQRRRETAVRLALGIGRGRLFAQGMLESFVVALLGAAGGLGIAHWIGALSRALLTPTADAAAQPFLARRTLGVILGLTFAMALGIGTATTLLAGKGDLAPALRGGGRGATPRASRVRAGLLIVQGALSVTLLTGAILFVLSFHSAKAMWTGYDTSRVLLVNLSPRDTPIDPEARATLYRTMKATAEALPETDGASWAINAPLWATTRPPIFVDGIDSTARLGEFTTNAVGAEYFGVMGTPIVRGRAITAEDRAGGPPVVVVSQGTARTLWPGQEALGHCIRVFADTMPCATVVGIAEDMIQGAYQLPLLQRNQLYLSLDQFQALSPVRLLLVRVRTAPAGPKESVRRALQRVMPGNAYVNVLSLRELMDAAHRPWYLGATMFTVFGLLALVVAAVGLYGVIGYNVAQRTREIGVRVALGARRGDVLRLVVGQSFRYILAAIALGTALALAASHWLQPLLFKQSATDPVVYGVVALLMLGVAALASATPAARAAKIDPNTTLRAE